MENDFSEKASVSENILSEKHEEQLSVLVSDEDFREIAVKLAKKSAGGAGAETPDEKKPAENTAASVGSSASGAVGCQKSAESSASGAVSCQKSSESSASGAVGCQKSTETSANGAVSCQKNSETSANGAANCQKSSDSSANGAVGCQKSTETSANGAVSCQKNSETSANGAAELQNSSETSANGTDNFAGEKHPSDMEIMEHTANIWQYMDIIDNGTEMHSEFHEKYSQTPFGKIIGARVRGKAHKHNGTNCDDYFETAFTDDFAIAAVCDGAGSKPLSRIGSRVSSQSCIKFLKENLAALFSSEAELKNQLCENLNSEEFMQACAKIAALVRQSAREALKAQEDELKKLENDEKYISALKRKPVIADLSTTFLAAVIVPLPKLINGEKQRFIVCVQIGDGCICAINSREDAEHSVKLMGEADSGKFSSETDFLSAKNTTDAAIAAKTRVSRGSSDVIMLMTDGVADDYFPAVPMMQRLYLDLGLNGIINMKGDASQAEDPAPIRFRSVSMSKQSVALQYAKQLLFDSSPESMKALWEKREALKCHSLEAFRINIGDSPNERLRVWLDNYNERTSFDDRTLVIIDFSEDV